MPLEIEKSDRTELKAYFVRNAIPTEANFAAFIDAAPNQKDDGLAKAANNPLSLEAGVSAAPDKRVLDLYETFGDEQPAWTFSLKTGRAEGLGIKGGPASAAPRLFIDAATGNVGIGTGQPADAVDIAGGLRVLTASNPIRLTDQWSDFGNLRGPRNHAEISNDTNGYKSLMIAGNRSSDGKVRRVSIWDRLDVNGDLDVAGSVHMLTSHNPIRVTTGWSSFTRPGGPRNHAEISNDTSSYKTLMIVGNTSSDPKVRRVSVWDRLEINGTLLVTSDVQVNRNMTVNGTHVVRGDVRMLSGSNPILFNRAYTGFSNDKLNGAEITNDSTAYKTLMIIGNKSNGGLSGPRRVSVWDRLEVNGSLHVNGTLTVARQEGWKNVSYAPASGFIPGWKRYHASWGNAGYFKDSLGIVHLRGLMAGGVLNRAAFTLPAGYRPTTTNLFACQTHPNAIGRVDVLTNGQVIVRQGNPLWVSLYGLSFPTTV